MIRFVRMARPLIAIALTGAAMLATSTTASSTNAPSTLATHTTAAAAYTLDAATDPIAVTARKATGRWAPGYTGKQVHATWAGPDVGLIAWTVALSTNTYKQCHSDWTTVNVDIAWNSSALHNGAQLVLVASVETSDGHWRNVSPTLFISKAVPWPGHAAFDGQYRAQVYTPRGIHVTVAHIQSWIDNGGDWFPDPTGSGDSVTLAQYKHC